MNVRKLALAAGAVALCAAAFAQAQVPQYGSNITLDQAIPLADTGAFRLPG